MEDVDGGGGGGGDGGAESSKFVTRVLAQSADVLEGGDSGDEDGAFIIPPMAERLKREDPIHTPNIPIENVFHIVNVPPEFRGPEVGTFASDVVSGFVSESHEFFGIVSESRGELLFRRQRQPSIDNNTGVPVSWATSLHIYQIDDVPMHMTSVEDVPPMPAPSTTPPIPTNTMQQIIDSHGYIPMRVMDTSRLICLAAPLSLLAFGEVVIVCCDITAPFVPCSGPPEFLDLIRTEVVAHVSCDGGGMSATNDLNLYSVQPVRKKLGKTASIGDGDNDPRYLAALAARDAHGESYTGSVYHHVRGDRLDDNGSAMHPGADDGYGEDGSMALHPSMRTNEEGELIDAHGNVIEYDDEEEGVADEGGTLTEEQIAKMANISVHQLRSFQVLDDVAETDEVDEGDGGDATHGGERDPTVMAADVLAAAAAAAGGGDDDEEGAREDTLARRATAAVSNLDPRAFTDILS